MVSKDIKDDVVKMAQGFFGTVTGILHDRRSTHPDPLEELKAIARLWSAYLGCEITPADAATMMLLLKVGRAKLHPHKDNEHDMAGYVFLRYLASAYTGTMAVLANKAQAGGQAAAEPAPTGKTDTTNTNSTTPQQNAGDRLLGELLYRALSR